MKHLKRYAVSVMAHRDGYNLHDVLFVEAEDEFDAKRQAIETWMKEHPKYCVQAKVLEVPVFGISMETQCWS